LPFSGGAGTFGTLLIRRWSRWPKRNWRQISAHWSRCYLGVGAVQPWSICGPYLGLDSPDYPDIEAPEPLNFLCNLAGSMQVWQMPSTGRWLGLTIGQVDRELPLELLVAVGEASTFPK
jgi:hypothetical protein